MNYSNNPYMNTYMNPQMNFNNPFMAQGVQQQRPVVNQQQTPQPVPQYNQIGLQGKTVDSIDVVKATDIPLDGSISYFPLVDGSSIVTKQLMQDGTSRMIVYKPVETRQPKQFEVQETYITEKELDEKLSKLDIKSFICFFIFSISSFNSLLSNASTKSK